MTQDMSSINSLQKEAVLHGDGPLLIVAGAGTGKTRTIACRIAHLVVSGVPPEKILAVSFTNKAANELRGRIQGMLRGGDEAPRVSTFHSFCARVLRQDIEHFGFKKNFTIYDTADQLGVVREVAREVNLAGRNLDAKRLLWLISRTKNEGGTPEPGDGSDEYRLLATALYPRYVAALKAYNALDFDDLLLMVRRLFTGNPRVLGEWKKKISHILVDEFQDTNTVQYELLRLLALPEGNLTVVGDDDQSIYGWRGAAPGNIHGFARGWRRVRVVTLEQNYRSTKTILTAANAVIANNRGRQAKNLWSGLGEGSPVKVVACASGEDEAEVVVGKIMILIASGRGRAGDCAVMFRTNAQSRLFEDVLRREGLRYVVIGGMRFYDRKEVRDLLAYLAFVHNPRDEISLLRIINYPARGIGRETVNRLQKASLSAGRPIAEILGASPSLEGVGEGPARSIRAFLARMAEARSWFGRGRLADGVHRLIEAFDLEKAVAESVKDRDVGQRKVENLREMAAAMAAFERRQPHAGLGEYLAGVNLSSREEEGSERSATAVTLMTVHAAKGLEFPHVFLTGLEEELFPHERSSTPGRLEEERRLVYVGMTRAMRSLTLTHAASRTRWSKEVVRQPSRFLDELPGTAVRREDRRAPREPGDAEEEAGIAGEFLARIRNRLSMHGP